MMEEEDSFCSGPEILLDNDNFSLNDSLTGTDSMASGFIPHRDVEESQRDKDIAGEGAVEVLRSRRMVIAMLLLTAALVITTTYIFLSREETDEFEKSVRLCIFRGRISNKRITTYNQGALPLTHTLCFVNYSTVHAKRKDYQRRCSVLRSQRTECATDPR
jgi:hypothetical protein